MQKFFAILISFNAFVAANAWSMPEETYENDEVVDEFNPYAEDAMETLRGFDEAYREETGEDTMSDFLNPFGDRIHFVGGCEHGGCQVFAMVVKSVQKLYLYLNGVHQATWAVSTGKAPYVTPNFDGHPSGPFYSGKYSSRKYPGGDWKGLGNMPYASFYKGGFAIHGTPAVNKLGRRDSHGCTRIHPENAKIFSQLVRGAGKQNVWFSVFNNPVSVLPNEPTTSAVGI